MSETIAEDKKPGVTAAPAPEPKPAEGEGEPSQDPIKKELDRVQKPRTEAEKAAYALKKNADRARELGLDPSEIIGGANKPKVDDVDEEDEQPVTVGMLKKRDQEIAAKTALTLADDIEDDAERQLVKHHLAVTIKPSGNPQEDLRNARALVNSVKNGMVLEELSRKTPPKSAGSGSSAPAKHETKFEPTADEQRMMSAPFNLTKAQIIAARAKEQQ